jgi:radical SAM protein with 4Fe4S-binding SPASM domain
MSDELYETILEQLKDWAPAHIKQTALMLNGEPLLDPNIEKRVIRAKAVGLPNVGITTNGFLMGEKRASSIIEASPDYIVFSFDTLDKNLFERNRIRLTHEKVQENVVGFIRKRNEANSNIRIVVRHIDFKGDGSEFDEYRRFFQALLKEDLDEIGYTKVHTASFSKSIKSEFRNGHCGTTPCGAVFNRLTIHHDGHVVLCPHDFNAEYDYGSVLEQHVLDIFNSSACNRVRGIHELGQRNTMSKCNGCDEPELNRDGDMYAKYTPSGKRFFADVFVGFDHDSERQKLQTP